MAALRCSCDELPPPHSSSLALIGGGYRGPGCLERPIDPSPTASSWAFGPHLCVLRLNSAAHASALTNWPLASVGQPVHSWRLWLKPQRSLAGVWPTRVSGSSMRWRAEITASDRSNLHHSPGKCPGPKASGALTCGHSARLESRGLHNHRPLLGFPG